MTKVSSTYLNQRLGRSGAECMACSSRSPIKRLAMMGDRREPMGVPSICSKKFNTAVLLPYQEGEGENLYNH